MAMSEFYQYQSNTGLMACDARMDERAFAYGDGFFSTIGVHKGRMICAPFHALRIRSGLSALRLSENVDGLMGELMALADQMGEGIIKLIVTRHQQAVRGYGFLQMQAQTFIKAMPSSIYQGVRFIDGIPIQPAAMRHMVLLEGRIAHRSPMLSGLKLIGCPEQVLIHAQLLDHQQRNDAIADGLVANVHDEWISSTMANVFYRIDGCWYTPPVDRSGVAGVMRAALMASTVLGKVHERVLTSDDLAMVASLITTNAVRGITPISALDGRDLVCDEW